MLLGLVHLFSHICLITVVTGRCLAFFFFSTLLFYLPFLGSLLVLFFCSSFFVGNSFATRLIVQHFVAVRNVLPMLQNVVFDSNGSASHRILSSIFNVSLQFLLFLRSVVAVFSLAVVAVIISRILSLFPTLISFAFGARFIPFFSIFHFSSEFSIRYS